ncbi:MAG: molybdate transport system substrate-binding protein [Actinomycetota bacterium]|nr:molybdate transport system substrate-binding protein [Actinomycetota bacterium]
MRRNFLTVTVAASWVTAGILLAGCTSGTGGSATKTPATKLPATEAPAAASGKVTGKVNVFAAASLKEAFTQLGHQFEARYPGTKVVLNFGPSSGLAAQINQGAPADVFASASSNNMGLVITAGKAAASTNFASNTMEIAVPPRNPAGITQLSDLARRGVKVAVCQNAVPCGSTAVNAFTNAKLTVVPVTQEVDVKAVLTKVTLGEVDAGVVYVTDVKAAGSKVKGITIPAAVNATTKYPIATLTKAPNKAAAKAFADYVLSANGARVLTATGFAKP